MLLILSLLLAGFLLAGCAAVPAATATPAPPVYRAVSEGEGNETSVSVEGQTVFVDLRSQRGIGRARIEHVSGDPAGNLVLRMHLAGLEEFRLFYNEISLSASVSSDDLHAITQSALTASEGERPITMDSPFWLDIQVTSDADSTQDPLDPGQFEITLPKIFLREGQAFKIQWVDFYR
jgi:hypothetical protein